MNRDATLAVSAALVLAAATAVAVLAPGAVADRSEPVRESRLSLQEPRIAAGTVDGQTAELSLDVRLDHRGGPARNVTVEVQAIDTDTGLVARTVRRSLGDLTADREVRTRLNVTVPREGGYRLETRVYEDGRRVETGRTIIRGVESLTPGYADTPVEFHDFGSGAEDPPVIRYAVERAEDNRTTLETRSYLTNRGDDPAGGLELVVTARQVESGVVADEATVEVGEIGPGQTATTTATLTVPAGYNYYLDGLLRKDGVIVGSVTAGAMLDPTRPVPEDGTREEVEFDAGDFADTATPRREADTPRPTDLASDGPGFGVGAALAALVALALVAHRRTQ